MSQRMNILTISGSARTNSANIKLLEAISALFPKLNFQRYPLEKLPLFHANLQDLPRPEVVLDWKTKIAKADALIISAPEYIYNMPAILKNALEWLTDGGELYEKKVLAITFAPTQGRAEKAMQSILWSLQALNADVVAQLPLFQDEVLFNDNNAFSNGSDLEMLKEAIKLLWI